LQVKCGRRFKRGLAKEPDPLEYKQKHEELALLKKLKNSDFGEKYTINFA
jgi:hypothetical protein